ncbi:MAG: hypothetical protein HY650_10485 [Acidobacteria bacterium]|nr:hypothetical protein [Acidobacteriota bacterium]
MDTLLEKLLEVIGDPVIIAVVLAFGITIGVLWRLFTKQHEFIRERVELLRQENQDLRKQVEQLRTENERLKNLSSQIQAVVVTLREQSSISENALERIVSVERRLLPELRSSLADVAERSERSDHQLVSVLAELKEVFVKQMVGRREVAQLAMLVESVADTSQDSSRRLAEIAQRARRIIDEIAD